MAHKRWAGIISSIDSDKVKERTEGIALAREFLGVSSNVSALAASTTHKWIASFQVLFAVVLNERESFIKKGLATVGKRLEDAASLVHQMAVAANTYLNKKVVKALLTHLLQTLTVSGKLASFALMYLKSVRAILEHSPHLEHIDPDNWAQIVQLSWSAVLGDPIKLISLQENYEDDESTTETTFATKKRTARQEDIELLYIIQAAFRSHSAPFTDSAAVLFSKFQRFLRLFSGAETTAHLPALAALGLLLQELHLNARREVQEYSFKFWPYIVALWNTKSPALKDQIVVCLKLLWPFVTPTQSITEEMAFKCVKSLLDAVLTEPTIRWREGYDLNIDSLRLEISQEDSVFSTRTVKFGSNFDEKQAISWVILELGADALAWLYQYFEKHPTNNTFETDIFGSPERTRAAKRRRVAEPLTAIIDSFSDSSLPTRVHVFHLQLLFFINSRSIDSIHFELVQKIHQKLIALLSMDEPLIQTWSLLGLGEMAIKRACQASTAHSTADLGESQVFESHTDTKSGFKVTNPWDQIWLFVLRKISNSNLCRVCSHTANVLLATEIIERNIVISTIETYSNEFEVQSPAFPSDALCYFLEWAIVLSISDIRLFKSRFVEKIFTWVSTGWNPLGGLVRGYSIAGGSKPHADPFSPGHLASLLFRLCGLPDFSLHQDPSLVSDSPVISLINGLFEIRNISTYLEGSIPESRHSRQSPKLKTPSSFNISVSISEELERRVNLWMNKTLKALCEKSEDEREAKALWDTMPYDFIARHLQVLSVVLIVHGQLLGVGRGSGVNPCEYAGQLISRIIPLMQLSKWQLEERIIMLQGLGSILVPLPAIDDKYFAVLLEPGKSSGVRQDLLADSTMDDDCLLDLHSPPFKLLRQIWTLPQTLRLLAELSAKFNSESSATQSTDQLISASMFSTQVHTEEDDGFGAIQVSKQTQTTSTFGTQENANDVWITHSIRVLISHKMAQEKASETVRVPTVVTAILNSPTDEAVLIARKLFLGIKRGLIGLSLGECSRILEHLGEDILPDYSHSNDETSLLAALEFLDCTGPLWILAKRNDAADELRRFSHMLIRFYRVKLQKNAMYSWRVRLAFLSFLNNYLIVDPGQNHWKSEDEMDENDFIPPTAIIPNFMQDVDFRVRFEMATAGPQLFIRTYGYLPEEEIMKDLTAKLQWNYSYTIALTQIPFLANTAIVSGTRRRAPYHLLLQYGSDNDQCSPQVMAVLDGMAKRLGLSSRQDLFRIYQRYEAYLLVQSLQRGASTIKILPHITGFENMAAMRACDSEDLGSVYLAFGFEEFFDSLCGILKRDSGLFKQQCLPLAFVIALLDGVPYELSEGVTLTGLEKTVEGRIEELVETYTPIFEDSSQLETFLQQSADQIMGFMLELLTKQYWSTTIDPQEYFAKDEAQARLFGKILNLQQDLELSEAAPPFTGLLGVNIVRKVFERRFTSIVDSEPIMFSVFLSLLARISEAPFVDEQLKLMIALAYALSVVEENVLQPVILRQLTHGLIYFIPRADVLVILSGILRWIFTTWINKDPTSFDLCLELVKAIHACQRSDTGKLPSDQKKTLHQLAKFLHASIKTLHTRATDSSQNHARFMASLWPHPLDFAVPSDVVTIIKSQTTPIPKFFLIKRLPWNSGLDLSTVGEILWRLLASASSRAPSIEESLVLYKFLSLTGLDITTPPLAEIGQHNSLDFEVMSSGGVKTALWNKMIGILVDFTYEASPELSFKTFTVLRNSAHRSTRQVWSTLPSHLREVGKIISLSAHPSLVCPVKPHELDDLDDPIYLHTDTPELWVLRICRFLVHATGSSDSLLEQMAHLFDKPRDIATRILPSVVHSALLFDLDTPSQIKQKISTLFSQILTNPRSHVDVLKIIVKMVFELRSIAQPGDKSGCSRDTWLDLSWLSVATAAVRSKQYFAALLSLELAHEYQSLFKSSSLNSVDESAQRLLVDIYSSIDEPDGFYGRESRDIRTAVIQRTEHEGRWRDALAFYGARYESLPLVIDSHTRSLNASGVITSLARFGFNHLSMTLLNSNRTSGMIQEGDVPSDIPYDNAWRADMWDLPVEESARGKSSVSLYSTLKAMHIERNPIDFMSCLEDFIASEAGKLCELRVDSPTPPKDAISTLLSLGEIHTWLSKNPYQADCDTFFTQKLRSPDFQKKERILRTRISLLESLQIRERASQFGDLMSSKHLNAAREEINHLLMLSEAARNAGEGQISLNAVTRAGNLTVDMDELVVSQVDSELSKVLWSQGQHMMAINLLKEVVTTRKTTNQALSLALLGEWVAEARLENATDIKDNYFIPAVKLADSVTDTSQRCKVYGIYASFADEEYQKIYKNHQSRVDRFHNYQTWKTKELADARKHILEQGIEQGPTLAEMEHSRRRVEQNIKQDEAKIKEEADRLEELLDTCLQMFALALSTASNHDDKIYRFVSLWMENEDNDRIQTVMTDLLRKIPSYKFVDLAYQLSARLQERGSSVFAGNVFKLVFRLCKDHPFHALYAVHPLRPPSTPAADEKAESARRRISRRSSAASTSLHSSGLSTSQNLKSRYAGSDELFAMVKQIPELRAKVENIELSCQAYEEWALLKLTDYSQYVKQSNGRKYVKTGEKLEILSHMSIRGKIKNLSIPVTTFRLPVDVSCRYADGFPSIHSYERTFSVAGGIHVPKIIVCIGDDGKRYKQLVKGEDDIRQDAVMEQAFDLINTLLERDENCRLRKLKFRTYKVFPLQRKCGILEFIDGAIGLKEVLTPLYNRMNHARKCISPDVARSRLSGHEQRGSGVAKCKTKKAEFLDILANFPPVMRYVFSEREHIPSNWFTMRLNYSRSVAVTSMVGHVFGLGDRHVSNILMDLVTGEFVPIDLGIAFEAGTLLPIPETVPFRLTQNLVDGFGINGVNGVFRRCCEETMRVLRQRSSVIMTVLEVFKHDPLQQWSLPLKTMQTSQSQPHDDANRALGIVKEKISTNTSVEYTVNKLIQEATDPGNLSGLYCGWTAYW